MYFLIYFSAIVTTLSVGGLIYFFLKHKKIKGLYNYTLKLYQELLTEKKEKESYKRCARFTTHGWNYTSEATKKPKPWDVVFELKEVALSVDETKSKFEIKSVASEQSPDPWDVKQYQKWFESNYGGGWLEVNNKDLEWITTTSKAEIRDEKLKQLGI
jgi:hypothetical protein